MQSEPPLVTVGIPTFNRVNGLESTLQCMIGQTYKQLDIVVSDNCSTDPAVARLLEQYAAKDSRIRYFIQENNISIVPNFQFLLHQAKGEYFLWAADDDKWDENFIAVCVRALEQNPEAVLAIGNVKITDRNNVGSDAKLTHGFMQKSLYSRMFMFTQAAMESKYFFCGLYRTSAVKNIPFENNWGGDHMFLLEAISKGGFMYLARQTNFYYFRGGSSSSSEKIKKAFDIQRNFFYTEGYVFRYAWYHCRFSHLNVGQKILLIFVNTAGLLFNEDRILYYALIKKPFMDLKRLISGRIRGSRHLPTYSQDGLTTLHNNGFMKDPEFIRAETAGAATGSWKNIHWRVHTILWAADHCKKIEGDFVECGTNKGGFAKAICTYIDINNTGKRFYLLDTFNGLSEDLLTKEEKLAGKKEHFASEYSDCYEEVKLTFADFPNVIIIKGTVPGTLPEVKTERVAFLSVDMNSVVPEIATLDFFWNKLSVGGMIVLDDYAFVTCDLQYLAFNQWAKGKGIRILTLATGQGLIVKQ